MTLVHPSINCHFKDDECVRSRTFTVLPFAKRVHVDVADGIFTVHKTWSDPAKWKELAGSIEFEVHLMTEDPVERANLWLQAGASRLIVHAETISPEDFAVFEGVCHNSGVELMLSSNPEFRPEGLSPYFGMTRFFQALAVHPGPSGQKFLPRTLQKISFIRSKVPDSIIEVDGGINPETAKECVAAGATELVSDEYIFSAPTPELAYKELGSL